MNLSQCHPKSIEKLGKK